MDFLHFNMLICSWLFEVLLFVFVILDYSLLAEGK